jgi:hypothetical protein
MRLFLLREFCLDCLHGSDRSRFLELRGKALSASIGGVLAFPRKSLFPAHCAISFESYRPAGSPRHSR